MVACIISAAWANVIVGVITAIILGWTLVWVRNYTKAAKDQAAASDRTAQAAVEQVEAAQKPCIVPGRVTQTGALVIRNVGSGPALHVVARHRPVMGAVIEQKAIGAIEQSEERVSSDWPDIGTRIDVTYESMSGTQYRTAIEVVAADSTTFTFGPSVER